MTLRERLATPGYRTLYVGSRVDSRDGERYWPHDRQLASWPERYLICSLEDNGRRVAPRPGDVFLIELDDLPQRNLTWKPVSIPTGLRLVGEHDLGTSYDSPNFELLRAYKRPPRHVSDRVHHQRRFVLAVDADFEEAGLLRFALSGEDAIVEEPCRCSCPYCSRKLYRLDRELVLAGYQLHLVQADDRDAEPRTP
jgi:hypothetical protein